MFVTFKACLKKIRKLHLRAKRVRLRFLTNYKNVDKYHAHLFLILQFSLHYLKKAKNWHPIIYLRVCNTYFHCFIKKPRSDIFQTNIFWIGLQPNPDISWKIYWGWLWGLNPNYGIVIQRCNTHLDISVLHNYSIFYEKY